MKAQALITAGLLLTALPAVGQNQIGAKIAETSSAGMMMSYNKPYLEKAAGSYQRCLKSRCDGVVESAIAYATYLRLVAPGLDLNAIQSELRDLAVSGTTPAIRYKAYLATVVFENPQSFENTQGAGDTEGNEFFIAISEKMRTTLLGYHEN